MVFSITSCLVSVRPYEPRKFTNPERLNHEPIETGNCAPEPESISELRPLVAADETVLTPELESELVPEELDELLPELELVLLLELELVLPEVVPVVVPVVDPLVDVVPVLLENIFLLF